MRRMTAAVMTVLVLCLAGPGVASALEQKDFGAAVADGYNQSGGKADVDTQEPKAVTDEITNHTLWVGTSNPAYPDYYIEVGYAKGWYYPNGDWYPRYGYYWGKIYPPYGYEFHGIAGDPGPDGTNHEYAIWYDIPADTWRMKIDGSQKATSQTENAGSDWVQVGAETDALTISNLIPGTDSWQYQYRSGGAWHDWPDARGHTENEHPPLHYYFRDKPVSGTAWAD